MLKLGFIKEDFTNHSMIIVTGAAGFIGSVLVWALNQRGRSDIWAVDKGLAGSALPANLHKRRLGGTMEPSKLLQRLESGASPGPVEAIFHLGACSDTTETDREYLRRNNTEYTNRLIDWSIRHGVYLAYASSAATYGDGELGYSDEDSLTPKLKPLNLYGQSKLDTDIWVLKNGLQNQVTGFRYFNVYGPNEYHKGGMRSLAQKGFEQIRDTGKLKLFKSYRKEYPDGGQKRDFIYVKDAVDAMLWFYDHPKVKGIFNLGTGRAQSWNDLARALFRAMGKPENIEYVEMPDNLKNQYQYFTEADLTKLRQAGCPTRFRPVEEGVADYVQYHLATNDPVL